MGNYHSRCKESKGKTEYDLAVANRDYKSNLEGGGQAVMT